MSDANSILILSACTATKASEGRDVALLAENLYAGQQHRRLMRGVNAYRDAGEPAGSLELHIVSAGHGVVAASERLRSYNATFAGMGRAQLRRRATRLRVPKAVANLLAQPRRLAVLLLGEDYLHAAHLHATTALGAPTIVFTSPGGARRLPPSPQLHPVPLDNSDARRFSCGLVALKGELGARLLSRLATAPQARAPLERTNLLRWLDDESAPPSVRACRDDLAKVA
jgi:hypothetical protein